MTLHGDTRVDEYFWLRDRADPAVMAYLEAENAYTRDARSHAVALETALYDEMLGYIKQDDTSAPYRRGGYYYYSRTQEGKQYPVYCRRRGSLTAAEEVLLDLNALAAGKAFLGLGEFQVSDDGNLLAYSIDETGYRQYRLYVKDLRSGSTVGQQIERVQRAVWATDNRTLLASTEDPVTKRADAIRRWELDAPSAAIVYREADELYDTSVHRTRDGSYITIVSEAKDTTEVRFLAADRPAEEPQLFAARQDGVRYYLDEREQRFYIRTNENAPDFRLFSTPAAEFERSGWTELLPQRPGVTITGIELFRDFVIVAGRRDGLASLELFDETTGVLKPLLFDEADYVVDVGQNEEYETSNFRFTYQSFLTPKSVYDLDVATGQRTLVKRVDVPGYDPAKYRAERIFVMAADGTSIPVSLVHKGEIKRDGSAPMLLYAYGSYGVSREPVFSAALLPLLDRGVTYAIAHVRGGGEYGEAWRLAGNLFNKGTSFTDFIDCAAGLIEACYTSHDRLVIQGASAGGLLVGAVTNMRPDLFRAAIAQVPFVDVLTTMLDASLPLTTNEYREWGNPNEKAAYDYMRAYSPVDNVAARPYPTMLIEVSFNDSQVPYWEGVKLAARIRSLSTSKNPVFVRANMGGGHGGSSGRYDALKERAFDYAFVLTEVGITR